jgi:hypothetical protein
MPPRYFIELISEYDFEVLGRPLLIMNPVLALWLLFCFFTIARSLLLDPRDIDAPFLTCYDYIICGESRLLIYMSRGFPNVQFPDLSVGGGVSGLVLANRLTEDLNGTGLEFFSGNK